jgi:hypothetical protein
MRPWGKKKSQVEYFFVALVNARHGKVLHQESAYVRITHRQVGETTGRASE